MKKNFTPVHKSKLPPMNNLQMGTLFVIGFSLYIFVCLNILASQSVSVLYFPFANEDKTAAAELLHKIQRLREYPQVLSMQRALFGPSINADIFRENQIRTDNIHKLELALQTNPKARDVLYALSILYKEDGQSDQSHFYLQKAQEIDPMLK